MKYNIFILLTAMLLMGCQNPIFEEEKLYISGRVFNAENDQPIAGVNVSTEPVTSSVTTDKDGKFRIDNVKSGVYKVIAVKQGFQSATITVTIEDKPVFADIPLLPLKPSISVSALNLDFGTDQTNKMITMKNVGLGTLDWKATKTANWLLIDPSSGQLSSGASAVMKVSVKRDNLQPGNYSDLIKITSNGGNVDITVQMSVKNPTQPQIYVYPKQIEFKVGETEKKLSLKNTGSGGTIKWNAVTNVNWLILSKSSGEFSNEDSIYVTAIRSNLSDGVYYGKISFSSNAGSEEVTVTLWVQNENPVLSVSPSYIDFGGEQFEKILTLTNIGTGGTITWQATTTVNWLSLSRTSGTFKRNDTLKVIAIRSNLTPGQSFGQVNINSNAGSAIVNVSIWSGNPALWVSTDYLDFDSTKSILQFEIRNSGTGILSWSISASHDWVNVTPKNGTDNATVNVSIDRTKILNPGVYNSSLLIISNGGNKTILIRVVKPDEKSKNEFSNSDLKIVVEKTSRPERGKIEIDISFTNLTKPDSGGRNMRICVDQKNSYLTDESSWKWDLKGDNNGFVRDPSWSSQGRVLINPGARVKGTFYFEPAQNSPNTGTIFQLVLTVVYRFEGFPDRTITAVFKNLEIN